jgi:endoglucanase
MRAFYGQRCGCAVDLGGGYSHPACHRVGAYHPSSGRGGPLDNHGGWHDAGDYGRYVVNSGITTGTLLWAWELYPGALRNLKLAIPESGTKLPDYLAEIRWNLEWMLQMQDDDGGVWHKQTSEQFCEFIMPQADLFTSYVIGTGAAPFRPLLSELRCGICRPVPHRRPACLELGHGSSRRSVSEPEGRHHWRVRRCALQR